MERLNRLFVYMIEIVGALNMGKTFTSNGLFSGDTDAEGSFVESKYLEKGIEFSGISFLQGYSRAEINTSIMLMGACTFMMGAFYFVNNQRMKSHAWQVISSTVCVFIAISAYSLVNLGAAYVIELHSKATVSLGNGFGLIRKHQVDATSSEEELWAMLKFMAVTQLIFFIVTELILGYVCGALFQNTALTEVVSLLSSNPIKKPGVKTEEQKLGIDFWGQLLGNFLMFSGLSLFSSIQNNVEFFTRSVSHSLTVVPVLAVYIGFLLCVMKIIHKIRMRNLSTTSGAKRQRYAEVLWDEESTNCIIGLGGVALAFLIIQAVQFGIVGILPEANGWISSDSLPPPPMMETSVISGLQPSSALQNAEAGRKLLVPKVEYFQPTDSMKTQLLRTVIGLFFFASVIMRVLTVVEASVKDKVQIDLSTPRPDEDLGGSIFFGVLLQLVKMATVIFCTSFAWGLLTVTRWYCSFINLQDIILYKTFVAVAIALVAFAVISILDSVFSYFDPDDDTAADDTSVSGNSPNTPFPNTSTPGINNISPGSGISGTNNSRRSASDVTALVRSSTRKLIESASESFGLDQSDTLEQMIAALGVISGAGFEEAFGSASAVLADEMDLFPANQETGKTLTHAFICIIVIVVMLPAWKWYILPTVHKLAAQ